MADTQMQAPPPPQPYPHGSRSPEPSYAAHIRKLESDYKVMEAEVERLRATLAQIAKHAPRVSIRAVVEMRDMASRAIASAGTGAEVER